MRNNKCHEFAALIIFMENDGDDNADDADDADTSDDDEDA